ncbi:hypothetical protein BU17DRAFT_37320 [Hysterangium stoloniferum]|nr:hypothetical protein BU17DRAFT_37320 [Hysterangium stoloniferum]
MTSLPGKLPARLQKSPTIQGAYSMVLEIEAAAKSTPLGKEGDDSERKKRLVFARVVGYLLLEGPSDRACTTVALEVASANNIEDRFKIGQMYFNHYIRYFRKSKGRTPTPSEHPSRPSFDALKQVIPGELKEPPKDQSVAKKLALLRDGYRCMITCTYDLNSVKENEEVKKLVTQSREIVGITQCAHIFPLSANANTSDSGGHGGGKECTATIWTIIERFGYVNLLKDLNDANIHRLENIMTLEPKLVQPNQPHTYKVKFGYPFMNLGNQFPELISFESKYKHLPLPSPTYLGIHAACARVCHLSGAAKYIDKYEREMEDIEVLSTDGASADILHYALESLTYSTTL